MNIKSGEFNKLLLVIFLILFVFPLTSFAASKETDNFIFNIESSDNNVNPNDFAQKIALEAENYRSTLSVEWFGKCLKKWNPKAEVTIKVIPKEKDKTESGGFFKFENKFVINMTASTNMLSTMIPHEILHLLFISYLEIPSSTPRGEIDKLWFMEGTAYLAGDSEAVIERRKKRLYKYITRPKNGFKLSELFDASQYPAFPSEHQLFYDQSISIVDFLTQQQCSGKRTFVSFIDKFRWENKSWDEALKETFTTNVDDAPLFSGVNDLQVKWLAWVRDGSPRLKAPEPGKESIKQMQSVFGVCNNSPLEPATSVDDKNPPGLWDYPSVPPYYEKEKSDVWVLKFCLPQSEECKRMEKDYQEAKKEVMKWYSLGAYPNIDIEFREVDISQNPVMTKRFEAKDATLTYIKDKSYYNRYGVSTKSQIVGEVEWLDKNDINK